MSSAFVFSADFYGTDEEDERNFPPPPPCPGCTALLERLPVYMQEPRSPHGSGRMGERKGYLYICRACERFWNCGYDGAFNVDHEGELDDETLDEYLDTTFVLRRDPPKK